MTGPNGNNIFIPLAGFKGDTRKYFCNEVGAYWSSTPYTDSKGSYCLYLNEEKMYIDWSVRYYGRTIRPVTDQDYIPLKDN